MFPLVTRAWSEPPANGSRKYLNPLALGSVTVFGGSERLKHDVATHETP